MSDRRAEPLLAAAAQLESRDRSVARELGRVVELAGRADELGKRARELALLLEALPTKLAATKRDEVELRARLRAAEATRSEAEGRVAKLAGGRRRAHEQQALAERELTRAREAVADADRGLERLERRRRELLDEERAAGVEADGLVVAAQAIAGELRELSRVSGSGRADPTPDLAGLAAWGDRVHAALLVVRSGLDIERDRVVREANELGAAVLGESLGGSSVSVVRRRLEERLGSG